MKVLIIARGVPHDNDPQEGCFEMDQAKALSALGHEVVIMSVDSRIRKYWRKIGVSKNVEGSITAYKLFLFPSSIIRNLISAKIGYWIEAGLAKWLYKYVKNRHGDFDIVHAHFLPCIYYGAEIKKSFGCRLIATEHWSELNKPELTGIVKYLGTKSYPVVDRLISVSSPLSRQIKNIFGVGSIVIHNLISDDFFGGNVNSVDDKTEFVFVCVGSLVKLKGFDFLIKAFADSEAKDNGAKILIVGGGPEKSNLKNQIDSLNLSDRILLLGQKNKKEIFRILHDADAFILPSRRENFSVSVLEALACGNPVIATICGGIRECIDSSNGVLVPVDDVKQMTNAIDTMCRNINNYSRSDISANCLAQYSSKAIACKLVQVYKDV